MRAEIVSIGTELLLGQIDDTDASYLSRRLAALGVSVYRRTTVGDNPQRAEAALREAVAGAPIVIATGGLGPTGDDVTRAAAARALGVELVEDPQAVAWLEAFFAARGRGLDAANRRQALAPQGALPLFNSAGTAPGVWWEGGDRLLILLPGPPRELKAVWESEVEPKLGDRSGQVILSRVLRVAGLPEAEVDTRLADLMAAENPTLAPLAGSGQVALRLTARAAGRDQACALLAPLEAEVLVRLGPHVYGAGEETLAHAAGRALARSALTLATAESCTGGLLGAAITAVPGSSAYYRGGVVAYDNSVKQHVLGVPAGLIHREGVVSEAVALAMAAGVRSSLAADVGLAVTGIAGPDGGTPSKPVGLVWLALADTGEATAWPRLYAGDRDQVRERSVADLLFTLYRRLKGF
ncbi:MAG: competence/damage-inducible protein A [Bacillota bacterium]